MKIDWKNLFNWKINSVAGPDAIVDKNGTITGYKVVVTYVHHGDKVLRFDNDNHAMYSLYRGPQDAAEQTAKMYRGKMARQYAHVR